MTDQTIPESGSSLSVRRSVYCVDLGGTHVRGAAIDEEGHIGRRFKRRTPHGNDADEIVKAIVDSARELDIKSLKAVSVAIPGTINVKDGSVLTAPNVPCLNGYPLSVVLQRELGCSVVVENDANAAAVGEMWQGAGRGHQTIVCLTLGTGVGGGIILDGKLWRGVNGSAAEVGHISVNPFGGVRCNCGSHDCLEVYASATAIVRQTRERLALYPNSVLQNIESLTSQQVYDAGMQSDALALEVFRVMGIYLGAGIASLINVINPEIVIIGGGAANGWELFETHMHNEVVSRKFPLPAALIPIVRAECGDDAGLLGAAHLAFTHSHQPSCQP